MQFLVIVRYADYGMYDKITSLGIQQMRDRVADISGLGEHITMLSSPATWAQESAHVLAHGLNIQFDLRPVLWSDNQHPMDTTAVLQLIGENAENCDVLVLLTHTEYAAYVPSYYAQEVLGVTWLARSLRRGEAVIINTEAKTFMHVR